MTVIESSPRAEAPRSHDEVDGEVSLLKHKILVRANLPAGAAAGAATAIQAAFRMVRSRQTTIRHVRDGAGSPLVTLRGQYLCGAAGGAAEPVPAVAAAAPAPRASGRGVRRLSVAPAPAQLDECGLPLGPGLTRLTLDNTKRNALYTTVRVAVETVEMGVQRCGSPERCWSGKPCRQFLDAGSDGEGPVDAAFRLKWDRRLVFSDEGRPRAPLDREVAIPLKSCLKRPAGAAEGVPPPRPEEGTVVVKRLVYAEVDARARYAVEDVLAAAEQLPGRKGRAKGPPKRAPARRKK